MKKGKFIVIDGLDGSGKKTQLDLLVLYCRKQKIKTATVDFPQYYKTFFGRLAGRYLNGEFGDVEETNPYLTGLTFAGDRWQAKPDMLKALKQGRLLLANRYTSSSAAFMAGKFKSSSKQDRFIDWIYELEQKIYGCPNEDFVIYLSVPVAIGQKLVIKKGKRRYTGRKQKLDIHEKNLVYMERVKQIYLRMIKKRKNWFFIDCMKGKKLLSPEEIHQMILKILKDKKII